jgi:protocatechuate 3,4-dioxygenase beta subunit
VSSRPTFEGRPFARPEEELVDQGLSFDIGTLLSRRQALRGLGIGAAVLGLAACAGGSDSSTSSSSASPTATKSPLRGANSATVSQEIPDETAGPYPGDGSNGPSVLSESGVIRSDIRSSFGDYSGTAQGVPMTLELVVRDLARGGTPFAGAAVYVWQCDREARYSLYSEGATDQNYLRGVQIADERGRARFTSIFPACYPGRWPHVHFQIYPDRASISDSTAAIATSQVALPQDVCETVYAQDGYEDSVRSLSRVSLSSDNVFGDDSGALQLGMAAGDVNTGYTVTLAVGIDTTTTPIGAAPR